MSDDVDEVEVRYSSRWELASEVASYGADVVVVVAAGRPRAVVIQRLRAAVAGPLEALA